MKRIFFLMIFLILASNVYAYSGISPAKININFEPNTESIIQFKLFGYEEIDTQIGCPDILVLDKIEPSKDYQIVYLKLSFQNKMENPGKNVCSIKFFEKTLNSNPNGIATATAVGGMILINVPYPGLYAELDLTSHNINKDDPLNFHMVVTNKGERKLENIKVDIKIFDSENVLVKTLSTDKVSIPQFEFRETDLIWDSNGFESGVYKAIAELDYGGEELAIDEESFIIGTIYVGFVNATKQGIPFQINPFNIIIDSWWGNPINNVFAEVYLQNKSGDNIEFFKTISLDLKPWETTTLTGFLDALNISEGEYNAKIIIKYENNETIKDWQYQLISKSNDHSFLESLNKIISNPIYILIIIIVIIISIDIIYLLKRKKRK